MFSLVVSFIFGLVEVEFFDLLKRKMVRMMNVFNSFSVIKLFDVFDLLNEVWYGV